MTPKTTNILYWVFTVLFALFMAGTSIPSIVPNEKAIDFMHTLLGYPVYFISFISVAKLLGSIAILIPGLNKIKEWAYAGLFFDLIGAFYSINAAAGKFDTSSVFILLPLVLGILSYYFWNKRKNGLR